MPKALPLLYALTLLIGLEVSTVLESGWTEALIGLAVVVVITGFQLLVSKCLRPKKVRLLFSREVITLPGGRTS